MERAMTKNSHSIRSRLAGWTVLVLAAALLAPAAALASRRHQLPSDRAPHAERSAILAVVVMDQDPARLLRMDRHEFARLRHAGGHVFGPFVGPETNDVWVVTVYDRRQLDGPFDQVTRFILPDGNVYETRTTPVEPGALPGTRANRDDIAEVPVAVQGAPRLRRVARMLPPGTIRAGQRRNATYTAVRLPVSGTWITKHNLYGKWKVEVETWKDGKLVSRGGTSFVVRNR